MIQRAGGKGDSGQQEPDRPPASCESLVLFSGGLDSTVALYDAVERHGVDSVSTLFIDWGQRALAEERRATITITGALRIKPPKEAVISFPYSSALDDQGLPLPLDRSPDEINAATLSPTFVPARNLVFLSIAFGLAFQLGAREVVIGVNLAADGAGYPDCSPSFLKVAGDAGNAALGEPGISIFAPVQGLSRTALIEEGERLGVPWGLTISCYSPRKGAPCGRCDSCILRADAFRSAGLPYS